MFLPIEEFLTKYKPNAFSVRDFTAFTIIRNEEDRLECLEPFATEFLHECLIDNTCIIKDKIEVNDTGIIIDGNIRHKILSQLFANFPHITIGDIEVETVQADYKDLFLNQLRNARIPLTLRQKIKALKRFRENILDADQVVESELGTKYKVYLRYIDEYEKLPEWLKVEADNFNVALTTILKFNREIAEEDKEKSWAKVKRYAVRDSVSTFNISASHVEMLKTSKGASSVFDQSENDLNENENLDQTAIEILQKLQAAFQDFDPENWFERYKKVCKNKKDFVLLTDRFLHIIESL